MLLIIAVPQGAEARLRAGLAGILGAEGLVVHLDSYPEGEPQVVEGDGYFLGVHGADHPGIVAAVAGLLADLGINIVDLSTHVIPGQVPVYVMTMEIVAPQHLGRRALEARLDAVSKEISCAITLHPVETAPGL